MDDLISRRAAIELAMEYCPDDDGSVGELGDLRELLDELENLPSAQKTGRWKGEGLGDYRCSLCGEITRRTRTRYCPHCGARMESD